MVNGKLILALFAGAFVAAQEIELEDIPLECRSVCVPVLEISNRCDNENDRVERDCICNAINGPSFAVCNECTLRFPQYFVDNDDDGNDNDDNEVNVWNNRCGFGSFASNTWFGTLTSIPTAIPTASLAVTGVFTTTICYNDPFDGPDDDDDDCVTRIVSGIVPVAAPTTTTASTTTTDASGVTFSPASTTASRTGSRTTETTRTTQATQAGGQGAQTSGSVSFDGGAMATAIPMLGAGAGMVLAALAAL